MKKNKDNGNTVNGVAAFTAEPYALPIQNELAYQDVSRSWWASPAVIVFVTIAMSVLDALVLYDIMNKATTQNKYLGYVLAFGVALILNMIPLITAKFMHKWHYNTDPQAKLWTIISIAAFLLLFIGTVVLRFSYADAYGDAAVTHLVNQADTAAATVSEDTGNNGKGIAVVLLLCIEPLATSILNFCLAYMSDDELRSEIYHLRKRSLELEEASSDLRAALATMHTEAERYETLGALDDERYDSMNELLADRRNLLKSRARLYLAEYLHNPEGASYVTSDCAE